LQASVQQPSVQQPSVRHAAQPSPVEEVPFVGLQLPVQQPWPPVARQDEELPVVQRL
jgi:hypothetical protein